MCRSGSGPAGDAGRPRPDPAHPPGVVFSVLDLAYLLLTLAVFAVLALVVRALEKL